jgi:hypothetical protein
MEIGVFDPKEIIELIAEEVGRNTYSIGRPHNYDQCICDWGGQKMIQDCGQFLPVDDDDLEFAIDFLVRHHWAD